MSKIPGYVIGPGCPTTVYYNQAQPQYVQAVPQVPNTVYIPPAPPGSRILISQAPVTPVVYAQQPPGSSVVYVNRSQPGQLGVLGARIGNIVDSAIAPPPQYTMYHQYSTQPVPAPPPQYVQYPSSNPPPPSYQAQDTKPPEYK